MKIWVKYYLISNIIYFLDSGDDNILLAQDVILFA